MSLNQATRSIIKKNVLTNNVLNAMPCNAQLQTFAQNLVLITLCSKKEDFVERESTAILFNVNQNKKTSKTSKIVEIN